MTNRNENKKAERCPQCGNMMKVGLHSNETYMGQCRVCKTAVRIRYQPPRGKLIRIMSASTN